MAEQYNTLSFHVTKTDYDLIMLAAKLTKCSKKTFIRNAVLEKTIQVIDELGKSEQLEMKFTRIDIIP